MAGSAVGVVSSHVVTKSSSLRIAAPMCRIVLSVCSMRVVTQLKYCLVSFWLDWVETTSCCNMAISVAFVGSPCLRGAERLCFAGELCPRAASRFAIVGVVGAETSIRSGRSGGAKVLLRTSAWSVAASSGALMASSSWSAGAVGPGAGAPGASSGPAASPSRASACPSGGALPCGSVGADTEPCSASGPMPAASAAAQAPAPSSNTPVPS